MFSDVMPPLVAPDSPDGRAWAREDWDDDVAYCRWYRPYKRDMALAKGDRYALYECMNRSPFGERHRNWCFVCPAGFMLTHQHVYDSALSRDRVMLADSSARR